jgi:DNA repair protein RAD51
VINAHATSVPTNPLSRFSATSIKPALGSSFTFTSDISLLIQETGKLFGMVDEGERERIRTAPGLRAVVEVLKSRVSVCP